MNANSHLRLWPLVVVVVLSLIASGCGGGSDSSSSSTQNSKPISEFLGSKEAKQLVGFGKEASAAEREAASAVLEQNLKARAAADFDTQCETLSLKAMKSVIGPAVNAQNAGEDCPFKLKKLAEPLKSTTKYRADHLDGPVTAMRIKGKTGLCLYHGDDGKDYIMPVEKEDGEWKVGAILDQELKPKKS